MIKTTDSIKFKVNYENFRLAKPPAVLTTVRQNLSFWVLRGEGAARDGLNLGSAKAGPGGAAVGRLIGFKDCC